MSSSKQIIIELAKELSDIYGGQENSDSANRADVCFGRKASDSSSNYSSIENENEPNDQTVEQFFN